MSAPEQMHPDAVRTAFVRATADEYEDAATKHPDLALQIDYYLPAWGNASRYDATRVLVVTGARWRIQALEAFLKAMTRADGDEAA